MLVTTMGQILLVCGFAICGLTLSKLTRIDSTVSCLLTGFLAGLSLPFLEVDTGIRAKNLQDIVFFVILPILIFEAAWHLKLKSLKRWIFPILTLATMGVLVSCLITAAIVYFFIGHASGFPWIAALLTGAILAATDPVAVIAQLKSLKVPTDLTTLFEGESLFNDATAIVLFSIILGIATQQAGDESYLLYFLRVFLGGLLCGIVIGLLSAIFVLVLRNKSTTVVVLILTAFASFYLAEHIFHVSGIMSVMFSAMITRWSMREFEDSLAQDVLPTWEWLGTLLNALLFTIMGLTMTIAMFIEQWLAIAIAIAASLIGRACAVISSSYTTRASTYNISTNRQILLTWGGLRGAIAIALVLCLPLSLPYWWTIQAMVFGVVTFSLLIQAPSNQWLVKKLELQQLA